MIKNIYMIYIFIFFKYLLSTANVYNTPVDIQLIPVCPNHIHPTILWKGGRKHHGLSPALCQGNKREKPMRWRHCLKGYDYNCSKHTIIYPLFLSTDDVLDFFWAQHMGRIAQENRPKTWCELQTHNKLIG